MKSLTNFTVKESELQKHLVKIEGFLTPKNLVIFIIKGNTGMSIVLYVQISREKWREDSQTPVMTFVINLHGDVLGEISPREAVGGSQDELRGHQRAHAFFRRASSLKV